jgi:hypothetical protein
MGKSHKNVFNKPFHKLQNYEKKQVSKLRNKIVKAERKQVQTYKEVGAATHKLLKKAGTGIKKAEQKAKYDIQKAANKTEKGIKLAAKSAGHAVTEGGKILGTGVKAAVKDVEKVGKQALDTLNSWKWPLILVGGAIAVTATVIVVKTYIR